MSWIIFLPFYSLKRVNGNDRIDFAYLFCPFWRHPRTLWYANESVFVFDYANESARTDAVFFCFLSIVLFVSFIWFAAQDRTGRVYFLRLFVCFFSVFLWQSLRFVHRWILPFLSRFTGFLPSFTDVIQFSPSTKLIFRDFAFWFVVFFQIHFPSHVFTKFLFPLEFLKRNTVGLPRGSQIFFFRRMIFCSRLEMSP